MLYNIHIALNKEMMKQVVILENKLSSLIDRYISDIKEQGDGFGQFTDEAILYAYLEYAKFPRDYTKMQRIKYLYEKCCEYLGIEHNKVIVTFAEEYDYFIVHTEEHTSSLPF